ncbi:sugar phosphate isomerase/epimerase [Paenibacillus anaericanus]|uniref:sugar phosphate isomerase/epimerase family protein n=1 Tax=Paenibacillus anaericanus TaxID=170367 RepID=UPI002781E4D3|nr:sugar phosphate isomerase/epimerase family protein [Paenibacillus anaericanus]MDQ0088267.1 sugar phosphate isomerase/epimerase [Paenibacillus anaericanus]
MVRVGLQLYTVREALDNDFEGTLRKVAELGYQGVEFAGFYGRSAQQVTEILNETGLIALGAHTPYEKLRDQLEEEITFNLAIGNRYLICPYLSEEDRNRWDEVIEDLKVIGKRCHEAGVVLCYHNHEFELTQLIGDKTVLDTIYEEVPASLLQVELDSCWVSYAGYDPLQYIAKYSDRLPILHLKDMITKEDGSPETVELGKGEITIKAIADAAVDAGVEWLVVEQDYCAQDALESIKVSMDWIQGYAKQGGNLNV